VLRRMRETSGQEWYYAKSTPITTGQ